MLSKKDQKTLEHLLTRDERTLHRFYSSHKNALFNYLCRRLGPSDAEEVLQDSFIGFIEGLRNFRSESSLKTFLYSIAKRKSVDKIRRKRVKRIFFSHFPDYVVDSLATVILKDDLDKEYLSKKIEKVFDKLPNEYSRILRLKYIEGYKVIEIAEEIQMSFKATESLLFRARQAFVKAYLDHERRGVFTFKKTIQ